MSYKENRYLKCFCVCMTSQQLHIAVKCFQQLKRKRTWLFIETKLFFSLLLALYGCKKSVKVINVISRVINLEMSSNENYLTKYVTFILKFIYIHNKAESTWRILWIESLESTLGMKCGFHFIYPFSPAGCFHRLGWGRGREQDCCQKLYYFKMKENSHVQNRYLKRPSTNTRHYKPHGTVLFTDGFMISSQFLKFSMCVCVCIYTFFKCSWASFKFVLSMLLLPLHPATGETFHSNSPFPVFLPF